MCVDDVLQFRHFVAKLFHLLVIGYFSKQIGDLIESIDNGSPRGDRFLNVALDVFIRVEIGFLRQISCNKSVGQSSRTVKILVGTRHDPQQRTFTRTVGSEHSDFCAWIKGQPNVFEDFFLSVAFS